MCKGRDRAWMSVPSQSKSLCYSFVHLLPWGNAASLDFTTYSILYAMYVCKQQSLNSLLQWFPWCFFIGIHLCLHCSIPFRLGTILAPTIAAALRKSALIHLVFLHHSSSWSYTSPKSTLRVSNPTSCIYVTVIAQAPKEETACANLWWVQVYQVGLHNEKGF